VSLREGAANAADAWEGYAIVFNGTKGGLEHQIVEHGGVAGASEVQGGIRPTASASIAAGSMASFFLPLRDLRAPREVSY